MAFKIKDLLIDVMSLGEKTAGLTNEAFKPVCNKYITRIPNPCFWWCTKHSPVIDDVNQQFECKRTLIPGCGITDDPWIRERTVLVRDDIAALADLKATLKQRLAEVEAHEAELHARMEPKEAEELELLEKKLTGALDEVRARMAMLDKGVR